MEITKDDIANIAFRLALEHLHADRGALADGESLTEGGPVEWRSNNVLAPIDDLRAEVSVWEEPPTKEEIEAVLDEVVEATIATYNARL